MSLNTPTARERLRTHFIGDESQHLQKWDDLWQQKFVPWDKGTPNPGLVDLFFERQDLFPSSPSAGASRKKALVPGCGKGYDVLLLSSLGYDAYGLDYSGTALDAARANEREFAGKGVYEGKEGVEKGKVIWVSGDFFKDDFLGVVDGEKSFDLIYDYTVMPPSLIMLWKRD